MRSPGVRRSSLPSSARYGYGRSSELVHSKRLPAMSCSPSGRCAGWPAAHGKSRSTRKTDDSERGSRHLTTPWESPRLTTTRGCLPFHFRGQTRSTPCAIRKRACPGNFSSRMIFISWGRDKASIAHANSRVLGLFRSILIGVRRRPAGKLEEQWSMRKYQIFDSKLAAKCFAERLNWQRVQVFGELHVRRFRPVDSQSFDIDLMLRHCSSVCQRVLSGRPNRVPAARYGNHPRVLTG